MLSPRTKSFTKLVKDECTEWMKFDLCRMETNEMKRLVVPKNTLLCFMIPIRSMLSILYGNTYKSETKYFLNIHYWSFCAKLSAILLQNRKIESIFYVHYQYFILNILRFYFLLFSVKIVIIFVKTRKWLYILEWIFTWQHQIVFTKFHPIKT